MEVQRSGDRSSSAVGENTEPLTRRTIVKMQPFIFQSNVNHFKIKIECCVLPHDYIPAARTFPHSNDSRSIVVDFVQ